jgi:hypothetical protein
MSSVVDIADDIGLTTLSPRGSLKSTYNVCIAEVITQIAICPFGSFWISRSGDQN